MTELFGLGLGLFGSVFGLRLIMPRVNYGFRAKMKSYAGTLTTKRVARLVTLIKRERMYATVSTARNKFFLSL